MAVLLPSLLTLMVASREAKPQNSRRLQATMLLQELEEAAINSKENDWSNVATAGTYHTEISGTNWSLQSGQETSNGFTKQIVIEDVYRDSNMDMVESGGTLDPSTKKLTAQVSWTTPIASSVSSEIYITRFANNTTWTQSTQTELDNGAFTNTVSTNNNGGEVELDQTTGSGDWATPTLSDIYDAAGTTDAFSLFVDGNYAYLGTTNLYIIDISDPSNVSLTGSLSVGDNINDIVVTGNYAFLGTTSDRSEVIIVDISNKSSPIEAVARNLAQKNDVLSLEISGNYLFVGRDVDSKTEELEVLDITTPSSPSPAGRLEIGYSVYDIESTAGYIYLATANDSKEVVVINAADPSNPSEAGSYNTGSTANGNGLFSDGSYLYLVTDNDGGGDEFHILDLTTPTSPTLISGFDVGGNSYEVFVDGDYAFVGNDSSGSELVVLDLSTISSPAQYGTYTVGSQINDVWVSGGYAYLASNDDAQELTIIQGGGGAGGYYTSGTYESQSFDALSEVAFNYIIFNGTEPSNTDLQIQIASNNDDATWNYVGPDGTSGTYYEGGDAIPLTQVLGRYFRFKAFFSSDGSDTPVLEDATVNYSP